MWRKVGSVFIGFALVVALVAILWTSSVLRPLDSALYDLQSRWLRAMGPSHLPQDVVVIGLDEAALEQLPEPYDLWHRYLGRLFAGLSRARPAVVGVAAALPIQSYNFLVPGIDDPLLDGVRALRSASPLILGQPMGIGGHLRPLAPELVAAAGGPPASTVLCEDPDSVVRRTHERHCVDEDRNPTLADQMARVLGRESDAKGLIDYTVGTPIQYVPLQKVLGWIDQGKDEELQKLVKDRAVVVASLLPNDARYRIPVPLAAWEPGARDAPAALIHVQALRSLLGRGLVAPAPAAGVALLAALGLMLWWGANGWPKTLAWIAAMALLTAVSVWALWRGWAAPLGSLMATATLAFAARLAWDTALNFRERRQLKVAFSGHVSPQIMRALLRGDLDPEAQGQLTHATILFADIRGFTTRGELKPPQDLIRLLNEFHGEMAAAIHGQGGAVDKIIGDGLMATFGVPQPLPAPERSALEAAQDMLLHVQRLNATLAARGEAPLIIGIGIHTGEVLAGYVGSRRRREYTAIGDVVNTASRLESSSKTLGYPIICSEAVAQAVDYGGGLVDLGLQAVRGHTDLHVWGWSPPILQAMATAPTLPAQRSSES